MLPLGHLAGGYLVSRCVFSVMGLPLGGNESLFAVGVAASVIPDLDVLYAFIRTRSATIQTASEDHRRYVSHRPLAWFALSVPIMLHGVGETGRIAGLLVLCGSWAHFALDSLQYGIMWLWPFSHKLYAYRDVGKDIVIDEKRFFPFWKTFLVRYVREFRLATGAELILIAVTVVIHFLYPL